MLLLRKIPGAVAASPLILTVGTALSLLLWKRRSEHLWMGLLLALCGLALLRAGPPPVRSDPQYARNAVVEGRVSMDSSAAPGSERAFLEVMRDHSGLFRPGEKVRVEGAGDSGQSGWEDFLVLRGDLVRYGRESGGCSGSIKVTRVERREPSRRLLVRAINHLRESFLDFCMEDVGGLERGRLLAGMLMGDVSMLGAESTVTLRRAGLSHTCAASGLHVAVIVGLIAAMARKLNLSRAAAFLLTALLIVLYVMLAGGRSPILRASLLIPVSFAAWLTGSRYHALSALGLILVALILWDPRLTGETSFQLTFAAAYGIILFSGSIGDALGAGGGGLSRLAACTLAAQLATLPLVVWRFGEISIVATISNMMVIPLMPLLMGSGMVGGISRALNLPLAGPLGKLTGFLAGLVLGCSKMLSSPGWAALEVGRFSLWAGAAYAALLLAVLRKGVSRRTRRAFLVALLAVVVLACFVRSLGNGHGERAVFFDVGQGDSFLLQSEGGVNVLVDGGESEAVLERKLRRYGVRHLDLIILSHPDEDHVGGLDAALRECSVEAIMETGSVGGRAYLEWREAVQEEGAVPLKAQAGYHLKMGDMDIEVFAPGEEWRGSSRNQSSLICRLSMNSFSVLATGDAEEEEERSLVGSGKELKADVLKVPHHGGYSPCSREFFSKVRMAVAVISVGRGNRYGHPHTDTLEALEESGCHTCRTDRGGDIIVEAVKGGGLLVTERR